MWNSRWQGFQYRQKLKWIQVKMGHCLSLAPSLRYHIFAPRNFQTRTSVFSRENPVLTLLSIAKVTADHVEESSVFLTGVRGTDWTYHDGCWTLTHLPTNPTCTTGEMYAAVLRTIITLSPVPVSFTVLHIVCNWLITTRFYQLSDNIYIAILKAITVDFRKQSEVVLFISNL